MLLSAQVLPARSRLPWGQAVSQGDPLSPVNPLDQFNPAAFAARDTELYFRDVLLASFLAQATVLFYDVWQLKLPFLTIDGTPQGTVIYSTGNLPPVYATPGAVRHVKNSSVPYDAVNADDDLYARDAILYAALYDLAVNFVNNPLPVISIFPSLLNDTWSLAEAPVTPIGATVSPGYPLNVSLFKTPDTDLAWRDNAIAQRVANLELAYTNLFPAANRFYLQASNTGGLEVLPEEYDLVSTTATTRTWAAYPRMPGHLELTYNLNTQEATWTSEAVGPTPGPTPCSPSFLTSTGNLVQLVNNIPQDQGPDFYRQKAARLVVRPWTDNLVFTTTNPNFYNTTTTTVYQPDAVLLTQPGTVSLALPVYLQSGYNRLSMLVLPSAEFSIYGFSNIAGIADGTAATLTAPGGIAWSAALPYGSLYFTVTFTDKTHQTAAFPVQVFYNNFLIFDGSWAFGQTPGALVTTPPVQFTSTGQAAVFEVVWSSGTGALTVDTVNFQSQVQSGTYNLAMQISDSGSEQLTLQAIPGRADVAALDIFLPESTPSPQVLLSWSGGAGFCLYLYAVDVTTFSGANLIENFASYEPHKAQLLKLALASVQRGYRNVLAASAATLEFRTLNSEYGYTWDTAANQAWVAALNSALGGSVTDAFKVSGPADIGRPALIPAGLELVVGSGGVVLANNTTPSCTPVLRTLQPWMILFGALVAGPDFFPTATRAGASGLRNGGYALPVTADFSYVVTGNEVLGPVLVSVATVVTVNGTVVSQPSFTASTYGNAGPLGGTVSQTVGLTAALDNLQVGSVYTVTMATTSTDLSGNVTTSTFTVGFTATGATQSVSLGTLVAATGLSVALNSITLS